MSDKRTVIIGLDGVPFEMIENFARDGVMPNMAEVIGDGVFRRMESTIPEISSVAWSSMITGANPGRHGIFGFTDLFDNTYKLRFPNYRDLRAEAFWDQWKQKCVIINVPSTYPVRQMNGVHISGFVSIDFDRSVYPESLKQTLKSLDYRLDVDSDKAHKSMELFLSDLKKTLEARIAAYEYLWTEADWQTFMLVFTGTDRLMHFLWDAYEDEKHKYHTQFLDHFNRIDQTIGEILKRISTKDRLLMLSDHGFERLDSDVYISHLLKEQGYLRFKAGEPPVLNNISDQTQAFLLDPARIYINYKDKFPCGSVDQSEGENILNNLEDLFSSLELDGKKVIKDIHRKQQIYSGPFMDKAPDMVLVAEKGFNLKANPKAEILADKGIFTGKHTQDTAFLAVRGVEEQFIPQTPEVSDVRAILEK